MNVSVYKDALLKKRVELEETAGLKPLTDSMEHNNGRQGDMADQAAGNNEVHIQLRLKQTDAKILQAIDEALMRIEKGSFGICKDCGEPIAEARLNAIPWTRVVHHLQGKAESVSAQALAGSDPRLSISNGSALLMRHEDVATTRHRLRHQQRVPVHHRARGDAPVVAAARAARPGRAAAAAIRRAARP